MKVTLRPWRLSLAITAALAWTASSAAQTPLPTVELAQPIAVPGEPATATINDDTLAPEPNFQTPAAAPAADESASLSAQRIEQLLNEPVGEATNGVELVKERYPSGAIKIERELTQDAEGNYVPHGDWRQFDEKGRLLVEGRYDHNRRVGLWRRYYREGEAQLLATSPYKDFSAPFISEATFDNGLLHGKWVITDAKQRKVSEIEFADGRRHGKASWYHPTGTLMSQAEYQAGQIHGDAVKWSAEGEIIGQQAFQNGRRPLTKIEYHSDKSKKSEVLYLSALVQIKTPDDWASCTLATFESVGEDEKHGPFQSWHSNGQISKQGTFENNLPVGKVDYWFANGQKEMEGSFELGKPVGVWTWWHENGQKAITGQYAAGRPTGQWSWWKDTGKLAQRTDLSAQRTARQPGNTADRAASQPRVDLTPLR